MTSLGNYEKDKQISGEITITPLTEGVIASKIENKYGILLFPFMYLLQLIER